MTSDVDEQRYSDAVFSNSTNARDRADVSENATNERKKMMNNKHGARVNSMNSEGG
jgi:hypothetical protein